MIVFPQGFLNLVGDYSIDYHNGNLPTHNKGGSLDVLCSRALRWNDGEAESCGSHLV